MVDENKFIADFLDAKEVTGWGWSEELESAYLELMREKLKDTEVCWVNPVVLLTFEHPEFLARGKKIYWEERLRESLFQPVAVDANNQRTLIDAYEKIVDAKEADQDHLTPSLKDVPFASNAQCYQCSLTGNNGSSRVTITHCREIGAIKVIPGNGKRIDHYASLFKISNPVWFLPNLPLGLNAARSPIFGEYLIGTYVGLKCADVSGSARAKVACACNAWNASPALQAALDWVIQLFFLRRLKDQGKVFFETMKQYSKQLQMLSLLAAPLEKLTSALDETIEHTQRLRAILYDPSRAIFAAAPRVMVYFEEGRQLGQGQLSWKAVHEPNAAGGSDKIRSVRLSLAAVICEIFGQIDPWPENEGALTSRARELLTRQHRDDELAFEQLRKTCLDVIGGVGCFDKETGYKKAASRFKKILYRPFKDGDMEYPLEPLLVGLYGFKPDLSLCVSIAGNEKVMGSLECGLDFLDADVIKLFASVGLPVSRYAHWLALLFGVIAFAKSEQSKDMERVDVEINASGVSVQVTFSGRVFETDKISELYNTMLKWFAGRDASLRYLGNLYKPFVDFALVANGTGKVDGDGFSIEHDDPNGRRTRTCIAVDDKTFRYSSQVNDRNERGAVASSPKPLSTANGSEKSIEMSASTNQEFTYLYFNHAQNAHEVDRLFGNDGEKYAKISSPPEFKDAQWHYSIIDNGTKSAPKICCFVHDTPQLERWVGLAKNNPNSIYVVFVSRSNDDPCTSHKDWPTDKNVDCFQPVSDLTKEALDGLLRDASGWFKK